METSFGRECRRRGVVSACHSRAALWRFEECFRVGEMRAGNLRPCFSLFSPSRYSLLSVAMVSNGGMDQRVPLVTKASILVMSLIFAAGLLEITNILLAHVFLAYTVLFQPPAAIQQSNYNNSTGARKKRKKKRPSMKETVEMQTIFLPPTEEDLDHIRRELEMSDPLPPIVTDIEDRDAFLVKSIISSTELLLKQRKEQLDKAKKEDDELSAAYLSFEKSLAQDTSTTNIAAKNDVDLTIRLKSLMDILGGRTSFKDMDTQNITILFESAIKELNWLLSMESDQSIDAQHARSTVLLNANNSFFQMLMNETNATTGIEANMSCQKFVLLDEGLIANEFIPQKSSQKVSTPPAVTEDTARESDLAQYVEQIKNKILLQKDKHKLIEEEIRSMIRPMITSIKEKRQAVLAQEKQMRNYWLDKIETLQNEYTKDLSDNEDIHNENTADKELCASSDVIKGMVTGGLEALRKQNDPYTAIVEAALGAAVAAGTSDEKMMHLTNEIELMNVPKIEHEMLKLPPPSKMTMNFIIDGSLLVHGMVGWIDYTVDSISGYNGKMFCVDVQR